LRITRRGRPVLLGSASFFPGDHLILRARTTSTPEVAAPATITTARSGGLMANAILRETGHAVPPRRRGGSWLHAEAYARLVGSVHPLPGARELLAYLSQSGVPWAVATSARGDSARPTLEALGIGPNVPVVTRDQVAHAKPDPDLFHAAAERLGVAIEDSVVVGDSVRDMLAARRARALGVGLLSGGYGQDELERAGAYRVYQDPADLLRHLDEVGARASE
jgi:HAD superfamily hydrolase (TIGR01549 family)